METQLYIGIMSGTSMDGADAVLVRMDGGKWLGAEGHAFTPYPDRLRRKLLDLQDTGTDELHRSRMLSQELSRLYAQTAAELLCSQNLAPCDITALGCHGQTVRHAPEHGYSIQHTACRFAAAGGTDADFYRRRLPQPRPCRRRTRCAARPRLSRSPVPR